MRNFLQLFLTILVSVAIVVVPFVVGKIVLNKEVPQPAVWVWVSGVVPIVCFFAVVGFLFLFVYFVWNMVEEMLDDLI